MWLNIHNVAADATGGFNSDRSILYNTHYNSGTIDEKSWTQGGNVVSGSLNLSSALALNGSTNGTYTLALGEGSFAAGSATTGIPPASNWNSSPLIDGQYTDQRGVVRTADQNTGIGAYSANIPTQVSLSGPATVLKDAIGSFTLTSVDGSGSSGTVTANTVFDLTPNPSGEFYSDTAGTASITQVTISDGSSAVTFYYRDDTFGTPTLTATESRGMELGSTSKDIRVSGNNALSFDGTDDYVNVGARTDAVKSVEFWVYPATTTEYFIDLDGGTHYIWANAGTLTATGFATTIRINGVETTAIKSGKWQHVSVTTDTAFNATNITIGKSGANYFQGKMDEIRMWNTARTEVQIRANMHRELQGNEAGLAGYYKLDTGTGTTASDSSGNSNDGTLTNGPAWQTSGAMSGPGNALEFDGTDDTVDCGSSLRDSLVGKSTMTLEAWIKPGALGGGTFGIRNILGDETDQINGNSILLRLGDGGVENNAPQLMLNLGGTDTKLTGAATDEIAVGDWCHIAAVYNGSKMQIYVNGVLNAQEDASGNIAKGAGAGNFDISPYYNAGDKRLFNGQIDEVRVWNVVRTAAQIRDNMCKSVQGDETGLVACYRMDQQAVDGQTILYDQTPNSYNGALSETMDPADDWVPSTAFNTWIGSDSTAWATVSNWSRNVAPGSSGNVGIPDYSDTTGYAEGNSPTIFGSPTVNHVVLATDAGSTLSSNLTMSGNLFLNADFGAGAHTVTVAGTTVNTGTLTIGGTGSVDCNGAYDASGGSTTFVGAGNLSLFSTYYLGTFTKGTGTIALDGTSAQTITGTLNPYNLTIANSDSVNASGATSLTVDNRLAVNDGTFTSASDYHHVSIAAGAALSLSGDITVGGNWDNDGTFTHNDHKVTFDGGDQTIEGTAANAFYALTIDGGGVKTLAGAIGVDNTLTFTNGLIALGDNDLTLGDNATIGGTLSTSNMIVTNGIGILKKIFRGTGSFVFPLGDNTGTAEYSPATLNFTGGTFNSAWAGVTVTNSKQPNNTSSTDYLKRYWTVNQSGITDFSCDTTFNYVQDDVEGSEADIYGAAYSESAWTSLGAVNTANNTFFGTVESFSDFTGVESYPVSYNANGATSGTAPDAQTKIYGVPLTLQNNTGSLAGTGYTYNGWNTAADGSGTHYDAGATYSGNAAMSLYAEWTANAYTVTFDKQSGTGGSSSVNATYGSAMPAANAPTRAGYTFGGYYTGTGGSGIQYYTTAMASAKNWDLATTATLYAQWTMNLPTQVALTGPASLNVGHVSSAFTLTGQDTQGIAVHVNQNTVFNLTSNSTGTTTFYSDAAGTTAITEVTIADGSSSATFYYKDTVTGSPTVTATRTSGMSLGSDTHQVTVSLAATTLATSSSVGASFSDFSVTVTTIRMFNGSSWVTIFSGSARLDVVKGGTFPDIGDVNLPAGTYSRIEVTFLNSFTMTGTLSYSGNTYYTTAGTFGGATHVANDPTTNAGAQAAYVFSVDDWGAFEKARTETFSIGPITVNESTDYQPTLLFTINKSFLLKGVADDTTTYYFKLSPPTVSIVEP